MVSKNESLWLTSGQTGESLASTQQLPVEFTRVEIGDASGNTPNLDPALTQLINKRQDGELISHELDPNDNSQRIITMAIPPTENFNAIEVLLYAKAGDNEFAHTYFTLASPFAVRTLENGGSQASLKYTIKVSQNSNFAVTAVPDLAYVTQKEHALDIKNLNAMTKAEFFALAQQRQAQNAGSGFSEWGKHISSDIPPYPEMQGLYYSSAVPSALLLGRRETTPYGISRTNEPVAIVNGVKLHIDRVAAASRYHNNIITFPPAPDGLDKKDNNGRFADLAEAVTSGGNNLETSILSRKDFVFLEIWHEKIAEKDIVYPLGNVQFGVNNYQDIGLNNSSIDQKYSAFGSWDTNTQGYGATWSELTEEDKTCFLQGQEHNIYCEGDDLIQVRYRVRVIAGLGDEWKTHWRLGNGITDNDLRVKPQGRQITRPASDLNSYDGDKYGWFVDKNNPEFGEYTSTKQGEKGLFYALESNTLHGESYEIGGEYYAHKGLCFALPIAIVQRRNQGAYHPCYNTQGTSVAVTNVNGTVFGNPWYESNVVKPNSASECFRVQFFGDLNPLAGSYADTGSLLSESSYRGKGRPDGKYHDAIYASDVNDLRMSSQKVDKGELLEIYKRKAIAGEIRGFERVPFTSPLSMHYAGTLTVAGTAHGEGIMEGHPRIGVPLEADTLLHGTLTSAKAGRYTILYGDNGNVMPVYGFNYISHPSGFSFIWTDYQNGPNRSEEFNTLFPPGTVISALILTEKNQHHSVQPMWTDINGTPAKIAEVFPDGVEGQWVPVIPDGSTKTYPFNRKYANYLQREVTDSNGTYWVLGTADTLDADSNSYSDPLTAEQIVLHHYQIHAHFTEHSSRSKVIEMGTVWAGAHNNLAYGAALVSSLINKVAINTGSTNAQITYYGLDHRRMLDSGTWGGGTCQHGTITLNGTGPALKALDYLSESEGRLRLNFLYKELYHNGTTWGDDDQFQVTDNQAQMTDDNGESIVYGIAGFDLPYFNSEVA